MRFILELEIEAIMHILNVKALLSSIVLNDELLKEKESPLVVDPLSDLDLCHPQVRRIGFLTVLALLISDYELHDKALLKKGTIEDLFLDSELDFYTSRVRLCPNEARINKLHSFQTLDLLKADGKKLTRFKGSMSPGRPQVAIALTTVVHH